MASLSLKSSSRDVVITEPYHDRFRDLKSAAVSKQSPKQLNIGETVIGSDDSYELLHMRLDAHFAKRFQLLQAAHLNSSFQHDGRAVQ